MRSGGALDASFSDKVFWGGHWVDGFGLPPGSWSAVYAGSPELEEGGATSRGMLIFDIA
jgi:hypothetical protein